MPSSKEHQKIEDAIRRKKMDKIAQVSFETTRAMDAIKRIKAEDIDTCQDELMEIRESLEFAQRRLEQIFGIDHIHHLLRVKGLLP